MSPFEADELPALGGEAGPQRRDVVLHLGERRDGQRRAGRVVVDRDDEHVRRRTPAQKPPTA